MNATDVGAMLHTSDSVAIGITNDEAGSYTDASIGDRLGMARA